MERPEKMDIYAYFDACREAGMTGEEALREYNNDAAVYRRYIIEELEERQMRTEWQQDLIDLRKMER